MPAEISNHRFAELQDQFAFTRDYAQRTSIPFDAPILDTIIGDVESSLERVEDRKSLFEIATEQAGEDGPDTGLYDRYVRQLDFAEMHLGRLQRTLAYLDLYHRQQEEFVDRLEYTGDVCEELTDVFQLDAVFLPVIWDGYAIIDILRGEFYVLWIPRDEATIANTPMVAHELGHAVLDQLDQIPPEQFRTRLDDLIQEFPTERQDDVLYGWNRWFEELFCDACGFFAFGPAYLLSVIYRLQQQDPYEIPEEVGPESEFHPPDALRYEFINSLATEYLPEPLYDETQPARRAYQQHLDLLNERKPLSYDSWIDDELLSVTKTSALDAVDPDLEDLCSELETEIPPSERPSREIRLQSNIHWLERSD